MMTVRSLINLVRWTPLHPQWLVGRRRFPKGLEFVTGFVLDVGSADRWIESRLSDAARYIALDYPVTGRGLYGAKPDVFADGTRLPFRDATIDAIVCLEVIEHVRDPAAILAEISRVLKPGGRAFLSMPFLYPVHDAPYDFQRFTAHGWARSLATAGLEQVSIKANGHALRAAALLVCLAIAGAVTRQKPIATLLLGVVAVPCIVIVNLIGALGASFWPNWEAMTQGFEVEAQKT